MLWYHTALGTRRRLSIIIQGGGKRTEGAGEGGEGGAGLREFALYCMRTEVATNLVVEGDGAGVLQRGKRWASNAFVHGQVRLSRVFYSYRYNKTARWAAEPNHRIGYSRRDSIAQQLRLLRGEVNRIYIYIYIMALIF